MLCGYAALQLMFALWILYQSENIIIDTLHTSFIAMLLAHQYALTVTFHALTVALYTWNVILHLTYHHHTHSRICKVVVQRCNNHLTSVTELAF